MKRERAWWASWKTRLAVCLVAVLLGALLAGLLMRLTPPSVAGRAATPAPWATLGPSPLPAPPVHVPAGWTQVLLISGMYGTFVRSLPPLG